MGNIERTLVLALHAHYKRCKSKAVIVFMIESTLSLVNDQALESRGNIDEIDSIESKLPHPIPKQLYKKIKYGDYICGVKIVPTSYKQNDLTLE